MLEKKRYKDTSRDSYLCSCKGGVTIDQGDKGYGKNRFWWEGQEFDLDRLILRRGGVKSAVNT